MLDMASSGVEGEVVNAMGSAERAGEVMNEREKRAADNAAPLERIEPDISPRKSVGTENRERLMLGM